MVVRCVVVVVEVIDAWAALILKRMLVCQNVRRWGETHGGSLDSHAASSSFPNIAGSILARGRASDVYE